MATFAPSSYQQAIFDFVTNGSGSAVIEAVAGSGKTTTILQALKLIPESDSVLMLAFNKSIADELKAKAPPHIDVKTFNGLGHSILGSRLGRVTLDTYKARNIVKSVMDEFDYREFGEFTLKLMEYARAYGLLPSGIRGVEIMPDTLDSWNWLIDHFGLPVGSTERLVVIDYAKKALIESINQAGDKKVIDFADQIYLPAIKNLKGNAYDWVIVDEAQDVSPIRTKLISLVLADTGRLIAVGDSRQAIYGFTGSDAEAMNTLRSTFNAVSLPLSISYRCAKSIVAEAQKTMPTIEASSTAPEGTVSTLDSFKLESFQAGNMVICRKNAPIVSLAFRLISRGIPARVMGRDIGAGLTSLIKKLSPKGINGKHGLTDKLTAWEAKEINKWQKEDRQDMIEAVQDKVACIHAVIARTSVNTVPDLIREIEAMFSDDPKNTRAVTLCSVHKSKGLESDTVYFLDREIIPMKSATQAWQLEQEFNLLYVGITRAKSALYFISSEAIR